VAAFHDREGRLLGHYTNLVRPPEIGDGRWRITDLFLDIWQPAGGGLRLLDEDELTEARERGWIEASEAARVRRLARLLMERARRGRWPPEPVRRWGLEEVEELRFRRDEPGRYAANLVTNRIIAFGIYFLGAASVTSLAFAGWTDGLVREGAARTAWLATLAVEAAGLLGVALAGRLPATRRVRPEEALTENTLFLGAALSAVAVLLVHEAGLWTTLLAAIYGTLGLFLAIFAGSRALLDREPPWLALAGLAVCVLALLVLL